MFSPRRLFDSFVFLFISFGQLSVVDVPPELSGQMPKPPNASLLMAKTIYLPVHKRTPAPMLRQLASHVAAVARQVNVRPVVFPVKSATITSSL